MTRTAPVLLLAGALLAGLLPASASAGAPGESRGPWDYYKLLQATPAEEAFRPLTEGGCPLVRS